jgi:polar amino acid transport system substrate-binding protein
MFPSVSTVAQDTTPLRVAIKPQTPFVMYNTDGSYNGFIIGLWEAIAEQNNWTFEYVPLETVPEVLDAVRAGDAEVGIAGISITREREETLDFSQPMFNAGLQIMTTVGGESPGIDLILRFFSPSLLLVFIVLFVVIILVGHLVWVVERKNPDFPDDYLPGVGEGIWWAASALIGGSDKMPRSAMGRVGALIWIVTGIVLIAFLTADLSAQNTVAQLQSNIRGFDDLPGKRIVTVANTTSADFLRQHNLLFSTVATIEAAYPLLESGRADAIVFDAPVLRHYAFTDGQGRVTLAGGVFARQDYGIVVQQDSPLRELIDRVLLALLEDGTYQAIMVRWFRTE